MRSLHLKLMLILILLELSIMAVMGTFLLNSVSNYHLDEFSGQMYQTFTENTQFAASLRAAADEENATVALTGVLRAYSGNLGIDLYNRNYYVLDPETGAWLAGSDGARGEDLDITPNVLAAISGQSGYTQNVTAKHMDIAVPVEGESGARFIIYIRDAKLRSQELTSELFLIIMEAMLIGFVVSVLLSFLLSKTMTTPIEGLTRSAEAIARGEFSGKIAVQSSDEIGILTRSFNDMATTLEKTLETVQNERDKLGTLFLRMTDGVCAFDRDGTLAQINLAAESMLGISYESGLGYEDVFGDVLPLREALAIRPPAYHEADKTVGDKSLRVFIAPYGDHEWDRGIMAVLHDVTEQNKLEHVRREFVANVSHELRTPLTNVKSYTETLYENDDIDRDTTKNFLEVVMNEADRMTRIVSDLLTLSQFDYGKIQLNLQETSIQRLMERVYEAMYLEAGRRGHNMTIEFRTMLPRIVCDPDRVEQVLINIVSNAVKYTPDGGEIELIAGTEAGEIVIEVRDNGIGIPEQDLGRLFERFYRVDKARSRAAGGSGLGLSIAKEIVEGHGGSITIDSVYGQGTAVVLRLPVRKDGRP